MRQTLNIFKEDKCYHKALRENVRKKQKTTHKEQRIVELSVCQFVCLSDTVVSSAKTAEPIEILFELKTWVGSWYHVLHGGADLPVARGKFEGKGRPIIKYRDALP